MPRILSLGTARRRGAQTMLAKVALAMADPRCTPEQRALLETEARRILREGETNPNRKLPNPNRPPRRR